VCITDEDEYDDAFDEFDEAGVDAGQTLDQVQYVRLISCISIPTSSITITVLQQHVLCLSLTLCVRSASNL